METITGEAATRPVAPTVQIGDVKVTLDELAQATEIVAPKRAGAGFGRERLRGFVERIERLEEEKKAVADDIKDVYAEAKGEGFDVKIMRIVVRLRKMDKADFQELEAMLDIYLTALGMR